MLSTSVWSVVSPARRLRLLTGAEFPGTGPRVRCRDLLRRKLLHVRRQRRLRKGAPPLPVRLIAQLADVGDEIPDHGIRENGPPSRHSVRASLIDREVDVFRLGAIEKDVVAERRPHAATAVVGVASIAVEVDEILHAAVGRLRIALSWVLDGRAARRCAGCEVADRHLHEHAGLYIAHGLAQIGTDGDAGLLGLLRLGQALLAW